MSKLWVTYPSCVTRAAEGGHTEVVNLLIEAGADVNRMGKSPMDPSALMMASQNGHFETVQVLLAKGANVNVKTKDGLNALRFPKARGGKYPAIVELLKKAGAKE